MLLNLLRIEGVIDPNFDQRGFTLYKFRPQVTERF